ncbi:MAG: flagellar biosynthesis regulator FlaF [Bdellovibrionales bacterium]
MANNPYGAYQKQQEQQEDIRLSEARALLRMAALMEEMQKPGASYLDYSDAVRQNQQLWTLFQAAMMEEDNKLPHALKQTLKGLSIYVDRRSLKAIGNHEPRLLSVLININKEIAAGLMESVKNDVSAAGAVLNAPPQSPSPQSGGSISGQF